MIMEVIMMPVIDSYELQEAMKLQYGDNFFGDNDFIEPILFGEEYQNDITTKANIVSLAEITYKGADGNGGQDQNTYAKKENCHSQGREKGDQHIGHHGFCGGRLSYLRGQTEGTGRIHRSLPPSSKCSRACRTTSSRGMRAGQI